jgi:hypothetical protein
MSRLDSENLEVILIVYVKAICKHGNLTLLSLRQIYRWHDLLLSEHSYFDRRRSRVE